MHTARPRLSPARPLPALAPYATAAAVALAAGWAAGLSRPDRLVLPVALLVLGSIKAAQRWIERRRHCAVADAWLRGGGRATHFEWRAEELTSPRERRLLARSLRGIVRELDPSGRRSAVPLNRPALRPHSDELTVIAVRLDHLELPVSPAGILEVQRLLTSPDSPLYLYAPESDLSKKLSAVHRKLEVRAR
jgi:hypothetical protein